jgi:hypothetical protein
MPMMGRHGAGSIVKRKHGPPYHATLIVGGRRLFRYAQTVKEAERALTELKRMRDNDLDPTRQTVADFLRSWMAGLRDAKRQRVRPRTLEHYELIVERHIIPGLGKHRLSNLREAHVQLGWMPMQAHPGQFIIIVRCSEGHSTWLSSADLSTVTQRWALNSLTRATRSQAAHHRRSPSRPRGHGR